VEKTVMRLPLSCDWRIARLPIAIVLLSSLLITVNRAHAAIQFDRGLLEATITSLADTVEREYMDAGIAEAVAASLRQRLADGRYTDVPSATALATALTSDLYELTRDKHLGVVVRPEVPASNPPTTATNDSARETIARRSNFGIQRVEILGGNIGYLDIRFFFRPNEAREVLAAAMGVLRNVDVLIIDMRANTGGSPDTIALILSYLFDKSGVELFEIIPRSGAGGDPYVTGTNPMPHSNSQRPVYVLTSSKTFSGGEGLAYILQ
jgi:hypothetical protein